jgi:hypothetical protein
MSEKAEDQASKEPEPIKESDANRVTEEEAERASQGREEGSEDATEPASG